MSQTTKQVHIATVKRQIADLLRKSPYTGVKRLSVNVEAIAWDRMCSDDLRVLGHVLSLANVVQVKGG